MTATLPTGWTRIPVSDPEIYLKIVLSIDVSINKGQLAEENDFPTELFSRICLNTTSNHIRVSLQQPRCKKPSEPAESEILPYVHSSYESKTSALPKCRDTPLSAGKTKKARSNQVDIQGAQPV
jgi:hypothetical protein